MTALEECHAKGFLFRAIGGCNAPKNAVNRCLRGERIQRTKENRDKAMEKRRAMEALWTDVDKNT